MAKKKNKKSQNTYQAPRRLHYPEDEKQHSWLSMLADAYYESDRSVYDTISRQMNKQNTTLACARGCSSCCKTHVTIPVYPLELLGLYWYILEKAKPEAREIIITQLMDFEPGKGCPFLVAGVCGVHPMRPMACRFFNVFTTPCREGEDPFYTRRQDVMTPDEKQKNKALAHMLPHHGITSRPERRDAMRNGYMHRFAKNLQNINWPKVALHLKNRDQAPLF